MNSPPFVRLLLFVLLASCPVLMAQESLTTLAKPTNRPPELAWGEEGDRGLQMGCWLDDNQRTLWCTIRNQSQEMVRYSDYLLGYWETVTLQARSKETDPWRAVARNQPMPAVSAGATNRNIRFLHPGKEMRPAIDRFGDWIPVPTVPAYSFGVDLDDYNWPEDLKNDVEVIIDQSLGRDGSKDTWEGVLQSGPVSVKTIQTAR